VGQTDARGSRLFIVDNSDSEWKVLRYLREWSDIATQFDIATGFFEIGGLLGLDGKWQQLDRIRILMGGDVTGRTRKAFLDALTGGASQKLDESIEREKETNDFLEGVPAVVAALRKGQIECRVYARDKFHAKAYITHGKHAVVGSAALVGSSNLTLPGITQNVELNIQIRREVEVLQDWFERHWKAAEDVTPEILRTVERHIREYSPFEVYAKSLQELFRGHAMTAVEWEKAGPENGGSHMWPVLDQYQREGYQALMQIARTYGGAFLCDAVGLGKTFIGLMLIERLVMHDRKRVLLLVPKSARADVWERLLRRYLPHVGGFRGGDFSSLVILNHTDLGRGGDFPYRLSRIKELADVLVIDEAHHFRNPGIRGDGAKKPSRYRQLFDLIEGPNGRKQVFMLTATPVNNRLDDVRHMIELFTQRDDGHFRSTLGINSLRGHFVRLNRALQAAMEGLDVDVTTAEMGMAEAEQVLRDDNLFRNAVEQRSRSYVRKSQLQAGSPLTLFPTREPPRVASYSVKRSYGRLLDKVEQAFEKEQPLFVLGTYYPLHYYKGPDSSIDPLAENRQKQVVGLIRTQFLKRFESSARAFEASCDTLLVKLLAWVTAQSQTEAEKRRLQAWKLRHADLIEYVHHRQTELWPEGGEECEEDRLSDEMAEEIQPLSRDEYRVEEMLADTYSDLDQLGVFLDELRKLDPRHDDKLQGLIKLLTSDSVLRREKVLIFSEFADTARYLAKQLQEGGIEGVEQLDSASKRDRSDVIRRFSPYYNDSSSAQLVSARRKEIRVLISTDVLSEGLNLQDCTRLINYDLHWNPVRLMQRIGRLDRRMDPEVEKHLVADHPEQAELRGKIVYWNFLPPDELEELLRLYTRVSHKTLRISKTFGIEGKKLLTPEDDYDALRDFEHAYEGTTTPIEEMHLELQKLFQDAPDLEAALDALPGRVFSGKRHPSEAARAVFFCYRIPRPDHSAKQEDGGFPWTEEAGETRWYLYDLASSAILEEPSEIIGFIRCKPDTPRHCTIERQTLVDIQKKIDRHVINTHMKSLQAPAGVRPILKAWMELS